MCHLELSDKGWLRQYWMNHSPGQLERFITLVVRRLNYVAEPTAQQLEDVRRAAYRDMKGLVE